MKTIEELEKELKKFREELDIARREKLPEEVRKEISEKIGETMTRLHLIYLQNMGPFNGDVEKIPSIPICSAKEYQEIVIPNFIRCGAIPKKDLIVGKTYIGECRNASEAVWNGEVFIYQRHKFHLVYPEEINHFEDDDGSDLFVPIKLKEE
ncbi:MAG: hypothetical protein J1F16_06230 [Muribaculaceae bacterium]|nr:hypothetical protein [Muribaculaceae bacterium]